MPSPGIPRQQNSPDSINPHIVGFILYCSRQQKQWPELYDEMCRVAGRGLYQGLRHSDLRRLGFSLSLNRLETTIQMIEAVTNSPIGSGSLASSP
ncbi:MAG: hypothetical protein FJ020_04255 [Chloroflexi bacterium]|nr:hypothetical protein [Chloroflexota bacterium]